MNRILLHHPKDIYHFYYEEDEENPFWNVYGYGHDDGHINYYYPEFTGEKGDGSGDGDGYGRWDGFGEGNGWGDGYGHEHGGGWGNGDGHGDGNTDGSYFADENDESPDRSGICKQGIGYPPITQVVLGEDESFSDFLGVLL